MFVGVLPDEDEVEKRKYEDGVAEETEEDSEEEDEHLLNESDRVFDLDHCRRQHRHQRERIEPIA